MEREGAGWRGEGWRGEGRGGEVRGGVERGRPLGSDRHSRLSGTLAAPPQCQG